MECDIEDVRVDFPYQPYSVQVDYMQKVIESLETKQFALLESPTGTGKTLSLLCAIFSYKEKTGSLARVIYASRTHSQLSNVIKELKKTRFRPSVTHIASRRQLCLEPRVKDKPPGVQARLCYELRKMKRCLFSHEDRITSNSPKLLTECRDLKEFIDEAKKLNVCPYMCAQINSTKADLILSPYNYLVDPGVRNRIPLEMFLGSIIVFDEAHNFPDQCSEFLSSDVPFSHFELAAKALRKVQSMQFDLGIHGKKSIDLNSLALITPLVSSLNQTAQNILASDEEIGDLLKLKKTPYQDSNFAIKKSSDFLFNLLDQSGINEGNYQATIDTLDNVLQCSIGVNSRLEPPEIASIENLQKFLSCIFQTLADRTTNKKFIEDFFSVSVTNQPAISLICFSPAPGFKQIADLHPWTVIMTSGTLSPMNSFAEELDQSFPIRLENGHVASPNQVFVGIVSEGYNKVSFEFTHTHRKDEQMKMSLVESMKRVFDKVPSGVLTFFPSFSFLDDIAPLFKRMSTHKKIWIEPRDNTKTQAVIDGFNRDAPRGAALLGVCRGKLSEGLDFSDDSARCVCVVGIPYPNLTDYKVQFKREWLDGKKNGLGSKWYLENAVRAVNQSIGRAIRHVNDYAAILLIDDRYLGLQSKLSKWIQPSVHRLKDWDDMIFQLKNFYQLKANGFSIPDKREVESIKDDSPAPVFVRSVAKSSNSPARIQRKEFKENSHNDRSSKFKAIEDLSQFSSKPLQLKSSNKNTLKQKPTKEEVKATLISFFGQGLSDENESKSSSSSNSFAMSLSAANKNEQKKRPTDQKTASSPLSLDSKVKMEEIVCVHCSLKAKSALKMKKMPCGHYSCLDCWELSNILQQKCPICRK